MKAKITVPPIFTTNEVTKPSVAQMERLRFHLNKPGRRYYIHILPKRWLTKASIYGPGKHVMLKGLTGTEWCSQNLK